MRIRHACLITLLASIALAPIASDARGINNAQYMEQFRLMMEQLVRADNAMYAQMQMVARRLDAYYAKHGHLPYSGVQQEKFKAAVDHDLPVNPYKPQTTELYYKMKLEEDGRSKMYFLNDAFLSKDRVRDYRVKAPEGWQADPGTIMVMVNGEGTYAIWATSADRQPLRDYQRNNRTRIICHDLAEELAQTSQPQ
jgi:hypothetical protein